MIIALFLYIIPFVLGNVLPWQREFLQLVNNLRASRGVPPVCLSEKLGKSASLYSGFLTATNRFGHNEKGTPRSRAEQVGMKASVISENLAGPGPVREAFAALEKSPPHLKNMVDANVDRVGFGGATQSSAHTGVHVMMFAKSAGTEPCLNPNSGARMAAVQPSSNPAPAPSFQRGQQQVQRSTQFSQRIRQQPAQQPRQQFQQPVQRIHHNVRQNTANVVNYNSDDQQSTSSNADGGNYASASAYASSSA